MIKRFTPNYAIFYAFIDYVLVVVALKLANLLRPVLSSFIVTLSDVQGPFALKPVLVIILALVWVIVLFQLGLYHPEKNIRVVDEVYNLIRGTIISSIIIAGLFYFLRISIPRLTFILFIVFTFVLQLFHRFIFRFFIKTKTERLRKGHRILVVGAGEVGRQYEKLINSYSDLGYKIIGFMDDDPNVIQENADVLGPIEETIRIIKEFQIDHLIIALPLRAYQKVNALVKEVHTLPVRVWIIPDYFSLMLSKGSVENFMGIPMIDLRAPVLSTEQIVIKRIFDYLLTIPLFILSLPLFGVIALLIKLDSDGPVLYRSIRLKENAETFEMLKFRTMIPDADAHLSEVIKKDEEGNIIHKRPDDPRVTRVGKFLRKTSLDELPQLINILKGDMSLVGPRPELPSMVKLYQPWQYKRFTVPQGLTGWWQINGRSDKPMHLHTEDDLYYIQNYSIWLDLQILIKTVLVVLRGKGAY